MLYIEMTMSRAKARKYDCVLYVIRMTFVALFVISERR